MEWKPIEEDKIWDLINMSFKRMSIPQRNLWESIRIDPEKWELHPYGDEGNGFWVVAIYGKNIIWYNDIEDGFNRSHYNKYGEILDYYCNQDDLEWTIQNMLNEIKDGFPSGGYASPPIPLI